MNINAQTIICGAIGNPIEHSLSPNIHNAGFQSLGLNFAFAAFHATNVKEAISGIRGLNIRGISVTIPHKVTVMEYLDEIDETAKKIGAVNTIVNDNGKLTGYNTDCDGAVQALKEQTSLKGKRILLVGAGGAARAIAFGLKKEGASIVITNRTVKKAKDLAEHVGVSFVEIEETANQKIDIIINATSVGMTPKENASAIPSVLLRKNVVVFDIVYTPKETKLIQDAKSAGCTIVYGYKMLLYQAVEQFKLFTKKDAPVAIMEQALVNALEKREK